MEPMFGPPLLGGRSPYFRVSLPDFLVGILGGNVSRLLGGVGIFLLVLCLFILFGSAVTGVGTEVILGQEVGACGSTAGGGDWWSWTFVRGFLFGTQGLLSDGGMVFCNRLAIRSAYVFIYGGGVLRFRLVVCRGEASCVST